MKVVLVNLNDGNDLDNYFYVNIERVELVESQSGIHKITEFVFPLDVDEIKEGCLPEDVNLYAGDGGVSDWQEYLLSLPDVAYQPHPQGDWKNWCSALPDGSISHDQMYW